jgi:hypothetical protein
MRTLNGTWHNQHGSQVDLELDSEGRVHGMMTVGDGLARSKAFPLVGFVRGDLIGFTVDFGRHGSVTSWTGHIYDEEGGPPRIEALWHMATLVPHPGKADERWKSVWTGADQFTPGAPPRDQPRQAPSPMIFWE